MTNPLLPDSAISIPLGISGTVATLNQDQEIKDAIYSLAREVLHDRSQMEIVVNRVYQLLVEEAHNRRERSQVYGGRL